VQISTLQALRASFSAFSSGVSSASGRLSETFASLAEAAGVAVATGVLVSSAVSGMAKKSDAAAKAKHLTILGDDFIDEIPF
jgi:F0F1-type ATP synthase membrane subunit c/vacuolar-type H+-ATPase subunit K